MKWDPLASTDKASLPPELASSPAPDVVAIDINGNRELPAVLDCVDVVWNVYHWQESSIFHCVILPTHSVDIIRWLFLENLEDGSLKHHLGWQVTLFFLKRLKNDSMKIYCVVTGGK